MSWKCSRIKVSQKSGEILEVKYADSHTEWTKASKEAIEVYKAHKGQFYHTEMGWDYLYVLYRVSDKRVKLKGELYGKNTIGEKRDIGSSCSTRVKRSRAKEAM